MSPTRMGEDANSRIGRSSRFEGKFAVKDSLKIDGKFEGDALIVDKVSIGPRGKVKTNIHASSVVVEGILIGNHGHRSEVRPGAFRTHDLRVP